MRFCRYAQIRKSVKSSKLKVFGKNKTKGPKHDSYTRFHKITNHVLGICKNIVICKQKLLNIQIYTYCYYVKIHVKRV